MITYPIFTLRKEPYRIFYTTDQIKVKKDIKSHTETLDDKTFGGDYFTRLVQMEHRINFDFTCGNLQDIILSKSRWGIDSKAKIHNLPSYNKIKSETRKVVRMAKNYIWIKYISYPFKIKTMENLPNISETLYAEIIKVDKKWYIKKFVEK